MAHSLELEHNKTFRLSNEASRLLEQEANDRNESANAIINRLIMKNLKTERAMNAVKVIHAFSQTIRALSEEVSNERMAEMGKELANDVVLRDLPIRVSGTMSAESILDTIKSIYEVHESEHDGRKMVFIVHYAGSKWSSLCGSFWKAMFESVGTKVELAIDDNAVVFKFEVKSIKPVTAH
ncbi:MAG: hypothetical protein ABSE82_04045 [Nitrososphaerales archaeon]